MALRYFKERMPELHVIGAGSLLEFTLNEENFSYPVGRIQFMYLGPLSFQEFLLGLEEKSLIEALSSVSLENPPSPPLHEHLLTRIREYFFVGGMPEVISLYKEEKNYRVCSELLRALYQSYKNDFSKYAPKTQYKYLQRFYEKAPQIIAKHFQYTKIDPEMRSRDLKIALRHLCEAGLLYQIFASAANGHPLQATLNERKFKIIFLDIGLLQSILNSQFLAEEDLHLINEGALAEQFVGQEFFAYQNYHQEKRLFFWERLKKKSAEIDFLYPHKKYIFPIEVKAGKIGKLKSLHQFLKEKKTPFGIRISKHPLCYENGVLSVPFYLLSILPKLIDEALQWGNEL